MQSKALRIVGWTCAILVAAFNLFAAVTKFIPIEPGSQADLMGQQLGMRGLEYPLGILEIVIVALFLIPRTSTVGFVLMVGYMGGVLATILTHGFSSAEAMPIYVSLLLLTVSAYVRNPELLTRIKAKPVLV